MTTTSYRVRVWREPGGTWSAQARDVEGAFTAGDSLAAIRRNIRESIAVSLDLPRGAEDTMDVELSVEVDDLDEAIAETRAARAAAKRAPELTARTVLALRDRGMSVRDVAALLDITPGRVTQIEQQTAAA